MIVLGLDPDTKTTGVGMLKDGAPVHAHLVAVPARQERVATRKLRMIELLADYLSNLRIENPDAMLIDRIVVEGQRIYPNAPARPNDILTLGQVAGALVGMCRLLWPNVEIVFPDPRDWKGTTKKAAFTRKIMASLKLDYDPRGGLGYIGGKVRVPGSTDLKKADATHVVDALGLAQWGWRTAPVRS